MGEVVVMLSAYEWLHSGQVGLARRIRNAKRGTLPQWGFNKDEVGAGQDVDAAGAELAVSKYLGKFWSGACGRAADVGDNIQVRHTWHRNGHLLIHKDDRDGEVFVLVTGGDGCFRLVGWLLSEDGKDARWLDEKRPGGEAFFVPQAELKPMEELW